MSAKPRILPKDDTSRERRMVFTGKTYRLTLTRRMILLELDVLTLLTHKFVFDLTCEGGKTNKRNHPPQTAKRIWALLRRSRSRSESGVAEMGIKTSSSFFSFNDEVVFLSSFPFPFTFTLSKDTTSEVQLISSELAAIFFCLMFQFSLLYLLITSSIRSI